MFGLGGIYVEALKDVVFRVAPIQALDAHDMVRSIRGVALLDGIRGAPRSRSARSPTYCCASHNWSRTICKSPSWI